MLVAATAVDDDCAVEIVDRFHIVTYKDLEDDDDGDDDDDDADPLLSKPKVIST